MFTSRRDALRLMLAGAAGAAILPAFSSVALAEPRVSGITPMGTYPFQLPELGYAYDALEPHIDARTMEVHHLRHHGAFTNGLNAALENHPRLHGMPLEAMLRSIGSLPAEIQTQVRNMGGGYYNHALFWENMRPGGSTLPEGSLAYAIDQQFGSFDTFKQRFDALARGVFGSGWAWLVKDADGGVALLSTPNQDAPLMQGVTPILALDVWEHAYYLKYQNRRPEYITAFWNVVNWDVCSARFEA